MNKSIIKICGISEKKTIECCIENNINLFGLIFYKKSPRYITINQANKLINYALNKNIDPVGVFVNKPISELNDILKKLNIEYLQLHGDEDNDYIKKIKEEKNIKILKAISIGDSKDLKEIQKYPEADMFLFDYKPLKNELPGGNAKKFNWEIIKKINISKPWFLSGGINIDNITDIKNYAIPYGIDISSGVEEKIGIKSNKKILSLIRLYESK